MRPFHLLRTVDVSGVSGTGVVAEGVQFSDGRVVLRWLTDVPSTAIYDSIDAIRHIHGHDGMTKVVWDQEAVKP